VSQGDDLELQGHARAHQGGKERQQRPNNAQHDSGGPGAETSKDASVG
jgi:hypothetical protein